MDPNKFLTATITYWAAPVLDGFGGYTWSAPVQIKGRWEKRNELVKNPIGEDVISKGIVYVNTDVDTGGYLYEGTSAEANPTLVTGAEEIISFEKIPNLRYNNYHRKVWTI